MLIFKAVSICYDICLHFVLGHVAFFGLGSLVRAIA